MKRGLYYAEHQTDFWFEKLCDCSRNCSGWEAFISHKKWSWLLYSYEHWWARRTERKSRKVWSDAGTASPDVWTGRGQKIRRGRRLDFFGRCKKPLQGPCKCKVRLPILREHWKILMRYGIIWDYFFQKTELTEKNDLSSTLVPDTNVVKIAST